MKKRNDKIIALLAAMMMLVGSLGLAYATGGNDGEESKTSSENLVQGQGLNQGQEEAKLKANENSQTNSQTNIQEIKMNNISVGTLVEGVLTNTFIATQAAIKGEATVAPMSTASALASEVVLDTKIRINFDKKVANSTENLSTDFVVKKISKDGSFGNKEITIEAATYEDNNKTIVLNLKGELDTDTYYQINVKPGVKSGAQNASDSSIAYAGIFKTGNQTGVAPEVPQIASLAAVLAYPINSSRNVEIEPEIFVEFNKAVKKNTINDKSVVVSTGGIVIPTTLTLSEDGKSLKVTPKEKLNYDTAYIIELTDKITDNNNVAPETLKAAKFTFTTKSARVTGIEGVFNTSGTALDILKINVDNLSGKEKDIGFKVEIRRDLGASNDGGGTVVYLETKTAKVSTGAITVLIGEDIDITKKYLFPDAEEIKGRTFVDVYLIDDSGVQIGDAYHQELKK